MNPMKWMMGYIMYWKEANPDWNAMEFFGRFNDAVVAQFVEYQLPVISPGKQTPKEAVCAVFEKVNTGGVVLNVFDLATASREVLLNALHDAGVGEDEFDEEPEYNEFGEVA